MSRDHFVSQFYLRQFEVSRAGKQKKHEVYLHDKWNQACPVKKSIIHVLQKENLFSFETPEGTPDKRLEQWYSKVESPSSRALKRLTTDPVGEISLSNDDWVAILTFIRMQMVRSAHEDIRNKIDCLDGLDQRQRDWIFSHLLGTVGDGAETGNPSFERFLAKKVRMRVVIDTTSRTFITSDTPVTIINGVGIGHDHCIILFPVSSKRLLVISTTNYLPDGNLVSADIGGFVTMANREVARHAKRFLVASNIEELVMTTSYFDARKYASFGRKKPA